jgi:hypothetical protein
MGHASCIGKIRNAYLGKSEGRRPLRIRRHRRENNIKPDPTINRI